MQNDKNWLLVEEILKRKSDLLKDVKLVLRTNILHDINIFLSQNLYGPSNSIVSVTDRKILDSFRTLLSDITKLSLTQRSPESIDEIDLFRFKNLRHLVLKNISIKNIKEITHLKSQLCFLSCDNCQNEEYLSIKGNLQWACLNILRFRYRSTFVKLDFLKSMPWLTHLDLSNNVIKQNEYINLPNLSVLNLSFNRLEEIPKLSPECQLKVLLIDHNLITDLKGIECFKTLTTLDISSNFISESSIDPLSFLVKIESIFVKDNLLSIIPNHRCIIASKIVSSITEFKIDGIALNNFEKTFLGKRRNLTNRTDDPRVIQCINEEMIEKPAQILRPKKKSKPKEATIDDLENPQESILTHDKSAFKNEENLKNEEVSEIKGLEKCDNEVFDINSMEEMAKIDELPVDSNYSSSPEESVFVTTTAILHKPDLKTDETQSSESDVIPDETQIIKSGVKQDEQFSKTDVIPDETQSSESDVKPEEAQFSESNIKSDEQFSKSDVKPEEAQFSEINVKSDEQSSYSDIIPDEEQSSESDITEKNIETALTQSSVSENNSIHNSNIHEETNEQIENNPIDTTENAEISDLNEDGFDSDIDGDEILWQVQLYDPFKRTSQIIFLALLENTIKERSTLTGKSLSKWSLDSIISCVKTKSDPIMIELEFNTPVINKQHRCYIMEYPDSQALMKRVYSILESRTLNDMDQVTYKCKICSTIFVIPKQKTEPVKCSICGDPDVVEMEEPRLPDTKANSSISHSPSESSIGSSISLENPKNSSFNSKRYESDVEIISNQSQSSIEVIDDQSRSQSTTPSRKKSYEERLIDLLGPQLTESSSSGSLTESVITAYDNNQSKKIHFESLIEENENNLETDNQAIEKKTKEDVKKGIYSYDDFVNIDERIKLYIYQNLFSSENEQLLAFVKSHIWKTGGSDYDGCFVISNFNVYFLNHSYTDYSEEICDWLSKCDSYKLEEMSQMMPMIKNQGVEIKIKNIMYFLLLMDDQATNNFILHIKGLNLPKFKMINKPNPKIDLILQQSIVNCDVRSSLDNDVTFFVIFKRIVITRDKVDEEIIRLGGLVSTSTEFFIIPGDLSWLSSYKPPSIHSAQQISRLMEMKGDGINSISFHFLDEEDATEEVWNLTLTSSQINTILSVLDIFKCVSLKG